MLKLVVFCTLIAATFGATLLANPPALVTSFKEARIVNGSTAATGQFPYTVSLRSSGNVHFCGGFIISNRYVGTAAHCLINRVTTQTISVVGTNHRVFGGTAHQTLRFVINPQYNSSSLANDIAMVQTQTVIQFTNLVQQIALGATVIGSGISATASGWGQTANPGLLAENLQYLTAPTLTNADCRARHLVQYRDMVYDNTICTFLRLGAGMCIYDSGAPLVALNSVIGSFSWGVACAQGYPDVYARISSHRTWMINNMT